MTELIMRIPGVVSGADGLFSSCVKGRSRGDNWEAWLEFTRTAGGGETVFVTGIETHQHTRAALERWASGLTRVYAEGALVRARPLHAETSASKLLVALEEIVEALDRRIPHVERASEPVIAADARRLRAVALARIDGLRRELACDREGSDDRRNHRPAPVKVATDGVGAGASDRGDSKEMNAMSTPANEHRDAMSGWEDEGGAAPSPSQRLTEVEQAQSDARTDEQQRFDASHAAATRGEHRYPDAHQTKAEQQTRRNRDDLKRRMSGSTD
jgi:hypothetical protein